jgi:hypothetical protein
MPIEDFYARSESDVVTFTKTQINFSASLVEKKHLLDCDYARIGVDPELRRIYFAFQKEAGPGLQKLFRQSGRSKRKMMAAKFLYAKYDWIAAVKDQENMAKKQFVLEDLDPSDSDVYPKYKYFITIGYAWAPDRDFHDQLQYPDEPGVYRLKKNGEVVRIGEGNNIATRLKDHLKEYAEEVDLYDFEIVPNEDERKTEQKRFLESFKTNVGRLPKLNPIAN